MKNDNEQMLTHENFPKMVQEKLYIEVRKDLEELQGFCLRMTKVLGDNVKEIKNLTEALAQTESLNTEIECVNEKQVKTIRDLIEKVFSMLQHVKDLELSKNKEIMIIKLLEVIKFYGNETNWHIDSKVDDIYITRNRTSLSSDREYVGNHNEMEIYIGGKKAREILQREDVRSYLK